VFARCDPWLPTATRERFRGALPACCEMDELATGGHDSHFSSQWVARVVEFVTERL
jgi:hypothetical protein